MHKIMILPICLGMFLAGIVMIPYSFAGDGCGPGTVLIDGVCELAPVEESSEGCGPGTVMVDGVCELDRSSKSTSNQSIYIAIGAVAAGGAILGVIIVIKRGSSASKPAQQEPEQTQRQAATKESTESCQKCGASLKPEARFCGKCGTPRS